MLVAVVPHFKGHHDDEAAQQGQPRIRGRGALPVMRMVVPTLELVRCLKPILSHEQRSAMIMRALMLITFYYAVQCLETLRKNCAQRTGHNQRFQCSSVEMRTRHASESQNKHATCCHIKLSPQEEKSSAFDAFFMQQRFPIVQRPPTAHTSEQTGWGATGVWEHTNSKS